MTAEQEIAPISQDHRNRQSCMHVLNKALDRHSKGKRYAPSHTKKARGREREAEREESCSLCIHTHSPHTRPNMEPTHVLRKCVSGVFVNNRNKLTVDV